MKTIISEFKSTVEKEDVFDQFFLSKLISEFKVELNIVLNHINIDLVKAILCDLQCTILECNTDYLIFEKNGEKIVWIFNNCDISVLDRGKIVKANKKNITSFIYDCLLSYLYNRYDTIAINPSEYQKVRNLFFIKELK